MSNEFIDVDERKGRSSVATLFLLGEAKRARRITQKTLLCGWFSMRPARAQSFESASNGAAQLSGSGFGDGRQAQACAMDISQMSEEEQLRAAMELSLQEATAPKERLRPSRPEPRSFSGKDATDALPPLCPASAKKPRGEPRERIAMEEKAVADVLQLLFGDSPEAPGACGRWLAPGERRGEVAAGGLLLEPAGGHRVGPVAEARRTLSGALRTSRTSLGCA